MKTSTENSSENPLERAPAEKEQVSVYSVNFTQNINNYNAEKEIILKPLNTEVLEEKNPSWLSKTVFKRRNFIGIAAILAIGVLHFAFQLAVIQNEKTQIAENPVKIETIREQPAATKPAEFEATKVDVILPEKNAPQIRQQKREITPAKPILLKKKDAAPPSKAERLRRAEKILTGI